MKNLATAFVELAGYLEIARFDDPDEAQGTKEVVGRCMVNATPEERAAIAGVPDSLRERQSREERLKMPSSITAYRTGRSSPMFLEWANQMLQPLDSAR